MSTGQGHVKAAAVPTWHWAQGDINTLLLQHQGEAGPWGPETLLLLLSPQKQASGGLLSIPSLQGQQGGLEALALRTHSL